jgi:hypothetical protein
VRRSVVSHTKRVPADADGSPEQEIAATLLVYLVVHEMCSIMSKRMRRWGTFGGADRRGRDIREESRTCVLPTAREEGARDM